MIAKSGYIRAPGRGTADGRRRRRSAGTRRPTDGRTQRGSGRGRRTRIAEGRGSVRRETRDWIFVDIGSVVVVVVIVVDEADVVVEIGSRFRKTTKFPPIVFRVYAESLRRTNHVLYRERKRWVM